MKKLLILTALIISLTLIAGCFAGTGGSSVDREEQAALGKEAVNYGVYKGDWKLKVTEDEELYLFTSLEEYLGTTGITIAETNNDLVKGSIFSIQGAPSHRQAMVDFAGRISDGRLTASYKDEAWLYSGNITLTFYDGRINANITRDRDEVTPITPMWGIPEGEFTFLRPIKTELVKLTDAEKRQLEQFLFPVSKDRIKPFRRGELTEEMMIDFVGVNIGLGLLDVSKFGDRVKEKDGKVMFDRSVMNGLASQYFGITVKDHKSGETAVYDQGIYTVPALGGVSEFPAVQMLMKAADLEDTYYALADYIFEHPEEGKQLMYQYLIELEKKDSYIIRAVKELKYPLQVKS